MIDDVGPEVAFSTVYFLSSASRQQAGQSRRSLSSVSFDSFWNLQYWYAQFPIRRPNDARKHSHKLSTASTVHRCFETIDKEKLQFV